MIWLQEKYIKLANLPLAEKKDCNYNFRCIICKDSINNKAKKRGYFILNKNSYYYYCHNCGVSLSFKNFFKEYYSYLYNEYVRENLENFKLTNTLYIKNIVENKKDIDFNKNNILKTLNKIIDIKEKNKIIDFILSRKLPNDFIKELYYTDDFQNFVNNNIEKKYKNPVKETRIIIPCYNEKNELIYIQGRSIDNNKIKFVTLKIKDDIKVYGMNKINNRKNVYIFEGVFDSVFIDNSIALLGANFNIDNINKIINNPIYILDNDFRYNKEIKNQYKKIIDKGNKICIFPKNIKEKDINEMILNGIDRNKINDIINNNIYCGFEAKIKLEL